MKKIIYFLVCIVFLLVPLTCEASSMSSPRLMVTGYEIEGGFISPEENANIKITLKNMSKRTSLYNIKVTLLSESGEIRTVGMPSDYIEKISYSEEYIYTKELEAVNTVKVGEHTLKFTVEYEDGSGIPYREEATLFVDVKQTVELSFSGAALPQKSVQGESVNISITLMNTGKTDLYNCKADFDIEGLLNSGSAFAGTILSGESKAASMNMKVGTDILGEIKGKIKISYEDTFGEKYEKTVDVMTVIEEKIEFDDTLSSDEENKNPLWWLFILIGLILGGFIGFGIPWFINDRKKRKDDDLRL